MKAISILLVLSAVASLAQKPPRKSECTPTKGLYGYECNGVDCVALTCTDGKIRIDPARTKEVKQRRDEEEAHKSLLAHAMVTRVLTPREMSEILDYGYLIFVQDGVPYYEEDLRKEFQAALDIQKTLREMNMKPCVTYP